MSIRLEEIARLLEASGISCKAMASQLVADIQIETSTVKSNAKVVFTAPLDGRLFRAQVVNFLPGDVMGKLMKSRRSLRELLFLGWRTPFGACEINGAADGLRFVVEFPLEDSVLTEAQLKKVVDGLMNGARAVCDLAVENLGRGWGLTLRERVLAAEKLIFEDNDSREDPMAAARFLLELASDESAPVDDRAAAAVVVRRMREGLLKHLAE